ncbi:hypothetical protein CZ771_14695 [Actinomycetales bacterium JB111]|nr:hypothetical protein CZ771_14695 [Actinomycetales bacterium JB111]
MDPTIHRGERPVADGYRLFAEREARGVSDVFEAWALAIADDDALATRIADLPPGNRQPNLVLAAARWHGADPSARPGDPFGTGSLRRTLEERWDDVRATVLARATQTNEAARTAVLLPYLARIDGPIALVEVGAAAGLCLLPDHYSFRYRTGADPATPEGGDGSLRLDPPSGPSPVVIDCRLTDIALPERMPTIAWRAGIDLNPIDAADPDAARWLSTLIWPGQDERRDRLTAALGIAREHPVRIDRGDLLEALPALAETAPGDATLVVMHTAVAAYLSAEDRAALRTMVSALPGHWLSCEGNRVLHEVGSMDRADRRFVLAVDDVPRALVDPHGTSAEALPGA